VASDPSTDLAAGLELVAGDPRELVVALAAGDRTALADPERAAAFLPLGDLDPSWLDALGEAIGDLGGGRVAPFRSGLRPLPDRLARSVEDEVWLVDARWLHAVAGVADEAVAAVARGWLVRLGVAEPSASDLALAAELAAAIVRFARRATTAEAVLCVSELPVTGAARPVGP
jgi:hypothetical protein